MYKDFGGKTDEEILNQEGEPALEDGEVLPEGEREALKCIIDAIDEDDKDVRNKQLRRWKMLDQYWQGIQNAVWDDVAHDWRTPQDILEEDPNFDLNPKDYERTINTYRANLEAIIAALTAAIPNVGFTPDDADDPDDIMTANAYRRIVELVEKHNDAKLLFIQVIYNLTNQGFCAVYNCAHTSEDYGTKKQDIYSSVPQETNEESCPECQADVTDEPESPDGMKMCPGCGQMVMPQDESYTSQVPQVTGQEDIPKTREVIEIYGPLNVKVPSYASDIHGCGYLVLEQEQHPAMMMEFYGHIAEKISKNRGSRQDDDFGRWARENEIGMNDDNVTLRRFWIRPWWFNVLRMNQKYDKYCDIFKKRYANGAFVTYVNDILAEIRPENIDEHWTIRQDPLANKIHSKCQGDFEAPIQDMRNEMIGLTLETVQNAVPETFVDSDALDWDVYKQGFRAPGVMVPLKPKAGMTAANRFHTPKPATISREVDTFIERLDRDGQQVIGALPAIWGGHTPGAKTLGEQELNRNQALQRLSLVWNMANVLWARVMEKAARSFHANMIEDEKLVKRNGSNSYITVWVRQSELTGKIGNCEPEASDQIPSSWNQKRAVLMDLLQLNNEAINSAIFHPENVSAVARLLGFTDMTIPGDDDRNKQLREIIELSQGAPLDPMHSSVPIEPDVDNSEVHVQTLKAWLVSPIGQYLKLTNPPGYENVLAHLREHLQFDMMQVQMEAQNAANQEGMNQPGPGINAGAAASRGTPTVEAPPDETVN